MRGFAGLGNLMTSDTLKLELKLASLGGWREQVVTHRICDVF